jgi:hypothetical protein
MNLRRCITGSPRRRIEMQSSYAYTRYLQAAREGQVMADLKVPTFDGHLNQSNTC